jgi:hypothetical protein
MSNGSSALDESASELFAYPAPDIQQSRLMLEEFCRRFEGGDMQNTADQILLFEKLNAGLFGDMTLMCFCLHAIVLWKHDEQQLNEEHHSVSVQNKNSCFKSN